MLKAKVAIAAGIVAGFAALLTILGLWRAESALLAAVAASLISMLPLLILPRDRAEGCEAGSAG